MTTSVKASETELKQYINRSGAITVDGLCFQVRVLDARIRFGHLDLLITPDIGTGERWVEHHKVELS